MAKSIRLIAACLLLLAIHGPAFGVIVFSEDIDGPLSFDNEDPTDLGLFMTGVNSVTGQVMFIGDPFDFDPASNPDEAHMAMTADVFSFEIPSGAQLDSIIMTSFDADSGIAVFIGLDDGPQFEYDAHTLNFFFPDLAPILKGAIVGLNNDFLTIGSAGGSGVSVPLGAGRYTMYIQENNDSTTDYSLQFNVSTASGVPEPSSVVALSSACIGWVAFGRRRRRQRVASKKVGFLHSA